MCCCITARRKVYAVDVGHGQLAWTLRQDERVVVLERTNARNLTADQVPEPVDLLVCDASFISLTKILPAGMSLTAPGAPAGRADQTRNSKSAAVRSARVGWSATPPCTPRFASAWRRLGRGAARLAGPWHCREPDQGAGRKRGVPDRCRTLALPVSGRKSPASSTVGYPVLPPRAQMSADRAPAVLPPRPIDGRS